MKIYLTLDQITEALRNPRLTLDQRAMLLKEQARQIRREKHSAKYAKVNRTRECKRRREQMNGKSDRRDSAGISSVADGSKQES